jgi:hypothetical protein
MITGMKITEVEAKKGTDGPVPNFDALFDFEDVKVNKDEVTLRFVYTAKYSDSGGYIRVKGILTSKEDKETAKKVEEESKNKRVPTEYIQSVVNTINYFGATNATVIASVMNMVPPIKMPALTFTKAGGAGGSAPVGKKEAKG